MRALLQFRTLFFCTGARPMPLETELEPLRKQLIWRARNLGVRQLDLIVGSWAMRTLPNWNQSQLQAFNDQVLQHETPELLKKVMGQLPIQSFESIISEIRVFALDGSVSKIENT